MSKAGPPAPDIIAKARAGDLAGAIMDGELALARQPADSALRLFVGVLCCRQGELDRGIGHLRKVMVEQPGNPVARLELARSLLGVADGAAVLDLTADAGPETAPGRDLMRLRGHALQQLRRTAEARDIFFRLITADPADFESRNGLGVALLSLGESRGALLEFREAARLRSTGVAFWVNLSRAAATISEWQEASDAASRALLLAPEDAPALLAAARAYAGLEDKVRAVAALDRACRQAAPTPEVWAEIAEIHGQMRDFASAEQAFRSAITGDTSLVRAWVGLGNIIERLNRQTDLEAHIDAALAAGIGEEPLALLRARLARKAGRHEDALALARRAPPEGDRATRAQLIGTLADRLGDHEAAFAAFAEANAAIAASVVGMKADAEANLARYTAMRALMTPEWLSGWANAKRKITPPDGRRDPLFIFGFPRSGTTLIDTMLSGHPDTAVLEEEAIIQSIASAIGRADKVPDLSQQTIAELRERYFIEVDARVANARDKLVVDKEPLGLSSVLLLHRIFPDARFVFAERHPCDVVLSCWMTSLRFNHRVGSFHDLAATARLYGAVLEFWTHCVRALPIATITVRYERLIVSPEPELRKLADFAGLDWQPRLLSNEKNAADRGYIGSPSYAQVGEPLYKHAAGRWTRYRPWIDEILPILAPWIEALGYSGT